MTDTPETDSWCGWGVGGLEVVPASCARKLERERDRLAAILKGIRNGYGGQVASPDCCEDCDFLIKIDEALKFLTNQPK